MAAGGADLECGGGGGGEDKILEDVDSRKDSSSSSSSSLMADINYPSDLETGGGVERIEDDVAAVERDCRICQLSLVSCSPAPGSDPIELGCSCKHELAAAHKRCAEAWFKIKGDKTCEICNSVATNVEAPTEKTPAAAAPPLPPQRAAAMVETESCAQGHRVLNVVLACMVFAFIITWLFHFNLRS
ncbi:uncharacterized protein LOC127251036 [Andrographis paniculata]|uniref:uncharacterized protein LOC127251036 n=1 Tax=Andrographis paniculata TaxID=175694 RepID=UPI0021E82793|nr:uncharacterized protein LOC127251036 [Andrographis paniculata]